MSLLSLASFTVHTGLSAETGAILLRCRKMTPEEAAASNRLVALSIAASKASTSGVGTLSPAQVALAEQMAAHLPAVELTDAEAAAALKTSQELAAELVKAVSVDGGQSWTPVKLVPSYSEVEGELWMGAFQPDLYPTLVLEGWGEYFSALVRVARFRSEAAAAAGGGGQPVRDAPERADEAPMG